MHTTMEKKMRSSATRNSIYKYICSTKAHPSAEMIYNDLKGDLPNLSLGTVYRNLKQLEKLGRVVRVTSVDNCERYDAICEEHAHFVCEKCGRVIDLMDADINEIKMACKLSSSVKIKQIKVVLNGICEKCSED